MRKILLLLGVSFVNFLFCQVGINTTNPQTTLEVRKNKNPNLAEGFIPPKISADSLQLKDHLYGLHQDGTMVYATEPITANTASLKTQFIDEKGYYIYDSFYTHPNNTTGIWNKMQLTSANNSSNQAFSASGDQNFTLLTFGVNLFGSEYKVVPISTDASLTKLGRNFLNSNNQYVVPKDGIYLINYNFKFGQGITAQLLSSQIPKITIAKTIGQNTELLDQSSFGGVQLLNLGALGVANVSLTEARISHIYQLSEGDLISFGVVTGGLNLSLLGDGATRISVNKL